MKAQTIITWAIRIIAAVILLQTLFFKFTGAEESKYIFTKLGAEPWGRIGSFNSYSCYNMDGCIAWFGHNGWRNFVSSFYFGYFS